MSASNNPCIPIRAVVFDLDGTLVDSLPDLSDALNNALEEAGHPGGIPVELVRDSLHDGLNGSVRAALDHLGLPPTLLPTIAQRYARLYDEQMARRTLPYPGVETMLTRLASSGIRLAVCTNKGEAQARQLLERLGLAARFDVVIGADTLPRSKPDPAPLQAALARLGGVEYLALMVGDSQVDLECARAAGLACAIHLGGYGRFGPGAKPADLHFNSYCDTDIEALLAFIEERLPPE